MFTKPKYTRVLYDCEYCGKRFTALVGKGVSFKEKLPCNQCMLETISEESE